MDSKYSKYKRLFPKIRLSNSLYYNYERSDWGKIWNYLLSIPEPENEAMVRGSRIHSQLEAIGVNDEYYKDATGKPEYEKFFELHVTERQVKYENTMPVDGDIIVDYIVSAKLDVLYSPYITDYKTGKLDSAEQQMKSYHWLVSNTKYPIFTRENFVEKKVEPMTDITKGYAIQVNDNLEYVKVKLVYFGEDSQAWEDKYGGFYQEIMHRINEGELDQYIKQLN